MRGRFWLLGPALRREGSRQLARFLCSLRAAGFYRVTLRHILTRNPTEDGGRWEFYLVDFDKIVVWEKCPALIARLLRQWDSKRILRELRQIVHYNEYCEFARELKRTSSGHEDL